jgi:histidyl-tRNA synthetase
VIAGGRYDGLIESLGGPHTPAIGWAAGIERLAMMIEAPKPETLDAVIIPMGMEAEPVALTALADLRRAGLTADMAFRGNLKKRLQKADASSARYVILIGSDELASGEVTVKSLRTGEQAKMKHSWVPQGILDLIFEDELAEDEGKTLEPLSERLRSE